MTDFVLVIAAAALIGAAPAAAPATDPLVLPASNVVPAAAPAPKAPLAAAVPQRRVFGSAEDCERAAAALPAARRAVCLPHGGAALVESAH